MKIQILGNISKITIKEVNLQQNLVMMEMNTKEMTLKLINQIKK
jgi:hypothetical protein